MSRHEDRATKRARKDAEADLRLARKAAHKAVDLKDPHLLAEAAVAATRGPVGIALFAGRKGLAVAKDRRAQQEEFARAVAGKASEQADRVASGPVAAELAAARTDVVEAVRKGKHTSRTKPKKQRSYAPLWITALLGSAAAAGATAYFLRDNTPSKPASGSPMAPKPAGTAATTTASTTTGTASTGTAAGAPQGGVTGTSAHADTAKTDSSMTAAAKSATGTAATSTAASADAETAGTASGLAGARAEDLAGHAATGESTDAPLFVKGNQENAGADETVVAESLAGEHAERTDTAARTDADAAQPQTGGGRHELKGDDDAK